jgi:hypothetical protein
MVNRLCKEMIVPDDEVNLEDRLAVLNQKRWDPAGQRLKVSFIDDPRPPQELCDRILLHLNAWSEFCSMSFEESNDDPEVRISLTSEGYWSCIGTDSLTIESGKPTMGLGGFNMDTPDAEFYRIVRHEAGHALGFIHEHLREEVVQLIDPVRAIEYYSGPPNYWNEETTTQNVLKPLPNDAILGTDQIDIHSVMCYFLPEDILIEGAPQIPGGDDITQFDRDFAANVYPLAA